MNTIQERFEQNLNRHLVECGLEPVTIDGLEHQPPLAAARDKVIDEDLISRAAAEAMGLRFEANLSNFEVSRSFIDQIPITYARQHVVIGLEPGHGVMPIVICSTDAREQVDVLSRFLGTPVEPMLAPRGEILNKINAAYQQQAGQTQQALDTLDGVEVLEEPAESTDREDLLDMSDRAPVIRLVNVVLLEAVKLMASDVHIQPYEDQLMVRMRIDGVLTDVFPIPKQRQEEIISRVKVMARMDIAEKRLAQDGRATVQSGSKTIDLRISSIPSSQGERVVIRLLDKSAQLYTLGRLGMSPETLKVFQPLIQAEHGLVLVTGPTGSGKSTTLYAALQEIDAKQRNILTLEDPIEFQLEGISQIQVSGKKGMTFAGGLRSVLRQDPDVIMVGEIRDHETAVMAIQSALTGHMVFSTLHTNDAASTVTRLLDLGIEPYLVASSVVAVLAQRLVRRVCPSCAEPDSTAVDQSHRLGKCDRIDLSRVMRGRGCQACRQTGYRGRVGVFELLTIDNDVRQQIQSRASAALIKATAIEKGMTTLAQDGLTKMQRGLTTIDEVLRVTTKMEF